MIDSPQDTNALAGTTRAPRDPSAPQAEQAGRFMAEVSDVLASSLDYETTLASVARLAVPRLADWCAVHVAGADGTIQQLALAHAGSAPIERVQRALGRYLDDAQAPYGVASVIRTGKPALLAHLPGEHDVDSRDRAADLGERSLMVVPLIAVGRTFGTITFISAAAGQPYGPSDLALALDLAHHAALAVDNARLYREAQSLNAALDQRVAQRTLELEQSNRRLETEIADHQNATDQLRLLAAHLQSAREQERIRIAQEIHDEIGTLMTAIKMDLAFLSKEIAGKSGKKSPESLCAEIAATTKLVDNAIQTVHGIVLELRPAVLDHMGLQPALEWQMQEFQARTQIECRSSFNLDSLHLDPERSTTVFRILQEALTNVARHAHATRVDASLRVQDRHLVLEVRDNGVGISAEQSSGTNRFGLLGMRERVHVFGGSVVVHGAPGQGTVVTVRIPVERSKEGGGD
jgi:signal transduction histidine kinase